MKEKNVIKGENRRDTLAKNWEYWGKHGIFTNHFMFEFGVAAAIVGKKFAEVTVTKQDLKLLEKEGYEAIFRQILREVLDLQTYEMFTKRGWDWRLARKVRVQLVPLISKAVTLGWYAGVKGIQS